MSKAEEAALQEYPKIIKRYRKLGDTKENTGSEYDENLEQRCIYIKGYHQAEKDLELTWVDMRELYIIFAEVDTEIELCKIDIKPETLGYYQEVLRRFKKLKK